MMENLWINQLFLLYVGLFCYKEGVIYFFSFGSNSPSFLRTITYRFAFVCFAICNKTYGTSQLPWLMIRLHKWIVTAIVLPSFQTSIHPVPDKNN